MDKNFRCIGLGWVVAMYKGECVHRCVNEGASALVDRGGKWTEMGDSERETLLHESKRDRNLVNLSALTKQNMLEFCRSFGCNLCKFIYILFERFQLV
jgi:hypothetical protein